MKMLRNLVALAAFLLAGSPALAGDKHAIRLQLFGKDVIGDYDGCHFALWQHNKNPQTDKYPYVFYAAFNDGQALPAWMQVGDDVLEMIKVDIAAADTGNIQKYQLYRSSNGVYTALMHIQEQTRNGNDIDIGKARITLIHDDSFPFHSRLKGRLGCPTAAYKEVAAADLEGDAISLGKPRQFDSIKKVPRTMRRHIKKNLPDCDLNNTPGYGARYAISGAMTLWEIPCAVYTAQGSSVLAAALNDNADYFTILPLPRPPGQKGGERFEVFNAVVRTDDAVITSTSLGSREDCGTYERHQLRAVEGEAVELFLLEYREKPDCDGVVIDPRKFPLVYAAQ